MAQLHPSGGLNLEEVVEVLASQAIVD